MLKLHSTFSRKTEDFIPLNPERVSMFVCGPTVYDRAHLGNAKTYVQFDFIARALRYLGYKLFYLQNITDIDDKIILRAKEKSLKPEVLAGEFENHYLQDMKLLGIISVDKYARASDYIHQIGGQVKRLVEKGFAYRISDGFYFDITRFEDYGRLSGRESLSPDDAVSRIDENPEKKNPGDFCLWKFKKDGEPFWSSSLGDGRPGWHIEDTAITESEFGEQYDIHGGARDLIFPHHEAEIAQMESISGKKPFVRYWLHTGFLNMEADKMSKSLGNFATLEDLASKGFSPLALRYLFISGHYRLSSKFSWEAVESAQNAYRKLKGFFSSLPEGAGKILDSYKQAFKTALENDFNAPETLALVWKLVKDDTLSPLDKRATLLDFDKVLGLDLERNEFEVEKVPLEVKNLLEKREKARSDGDFKKSDELREEIKKLGFTVGDSASGQKISKI